MKVLLSTDMKRAIFLDRDGVLVNDPGHLRNLNQVSFLPGIENLKKLEERGFILVIVSNQSGVARGYLTEKEIWKIDSYIRRALNKKGITINGSYYCPHHPDFTGKCDCRKPKPALFLKAISEFNIDLKKSVVIGDKPSDLLAGRRAGIKFGILLKRNQKYWDCRKDELKKVHYKANSIAGAVKIILEEIE